MDFRVFSRNISENMHARCVREDTKQALKGNLQADGVQSRQTLFVRYCLNGNQKCDLRQRDLIGFLKCDKQQRHKVVYHCLHNIADKTGVHRLLIRAIPHKDCATDASSNFSSDETKSGVNT